MSIKAEGKDYSDRVQVAFVSEGQVELYVLGRPHKAGEEGVWLLTGDRNLTGYCFLIVWEHPQPRPLEFETEVVKALKEIESEKK